jgi:hypothetical protein
MRSTGAITGLLLLATLALGGCGSEDDPGPTAPDPVDDPPVELEPIIITDTTGKEWDVSYAVRELDFVSTLFDLGLGPHAIRPVVNPRFYEPCWARTPATIRAPTPSPAPAATR